MEGSVDLLALRMWAVPGLGLAGSIHETVIPTFGQLAADSMRRPGATGQPVPLRFEDAVVEEVLQVLPSPEVRQKLILRYRVGDMLLRSEMLVEQRCAAQERRELEASAGTGTRHSRTPATGAGATPGLGRARHCGTEDPVSVLDHIA